MGHIISVINNKGGCGKTTVTTNLADALGKRNKTVLVVDNDSQSNSSSKLLPQHSHVTITKTMYDIYNNSENSFKNFSDYLINTEYKNVSLLANITKTANLEPKLIGEAPDSFFRLRKFLRETVSNDFDFIIIDNPPNMGTFVLCSLYSTDFVIVPVKAGSTDSVEGLNNALELIADVQEKGNPDLKFLRILINAVDRRTTVVKSVITLIQKAFGQDQLFNTQIPINTNFERAEARGQTIFKSNATSIGARQFRNLADEILTLLEGVHHVQK